jgi:carbon-monoxide dehydrogenase large subunit
MHTPEQMPLAEDRVLWHGQPVAAVLATSRALAEDAVSAIELELEETPAVIGVEAALAPDGPRVHPELGDNLCLRSTHETPDFAAAFAGAAVRLKRKLSFARHTGVPLEPRAILADFNPAKRSLLVHLSHQAPHMMRDLFAKHFSLPVNDVRVVCPDVGGGFGIKVHCYPEEMAAVAASMLCGRPVRYAADRTESFGSDIHAREHEIQVEVALQRDGTLVGFDLHDHAPIGAYSAYPRSSVLEGFLINRFTGAPYRHAAYRAVLEVLFQNKVPTSQYRSVGHPVLCATAEVMLDHAARQLGIDPVELRLRNVIPDAKQPHLGPSGFPFEALSHEASLHKLIELMGYAERRAEQARARQEGRLVGIGVSVLTEISGMGVSVYAQGGVPISSQDAAIMRLETDGSLTCSVCVADQGQGSDTAMAQIAATRLGVSLESVRVLHGDTGAVPMGGGAWGSRTVAIAGEAVLRAADQLRQGILAIASATLEQPVECLSIRSNEVFVTGHAQAAMTLSEVARLGWYRQDLLPRGFQPKLLAAATYVNPGAPMFTNCVQASMVEVDPRFGTVRLLRHWVVEDCGTIVNPLTADEQVRGAVVQGLGMALYEQCIYSPDGQLLTATLADYLVPMAAEMPDIEVAHVVTSTPLSTLGAKGAGEAGTGGAPAAVMNAVNDALAPLGAEVASFPITPQSVLQALGRI